MTTSLISIQTAILERLTEDEEFMRLVTGVFDAVPEGQAFPYVTIGEATEIPFNTFDRIGRDATYTLHIWSQYAGYREALEIQSQMVEVLDGTPVPISGFDLVYFLFDNATTLTDSDGITRHVPVRFRVVVQK